MLKIDLQNIKKLIILIFCGCSLNPGVEYVCNGSLLYIDGECVCIKNKNGFEDFPDIISIDMSNKACQEASLKKR